MIRILIKVSKFRVIFTDVLEDRILFLFVRDLIIFILHLSAAIINIHSDFNAGVTVSLRRFQCWGSSVSSPRISMPDLALLSVN